MTDEDTIQRFAKGINAKGVIESVKSKTKPLFRWRMRGTFTEKADLVRRMSPYLGERRNLQGRKILEYETRILAKRVKE